MTTFSQLSRCAVMLSVVLVLPARAEEPRRELGAHVHGQAALDIAIEGKRVVMVLRAPGADIVGFEGKAETPEAKATVAAATAKLEQPLALFGLPAAAQCTVVTAKVTVDDDDDDDHAKPSAPAANGADAKAEPPKAAHADHDHSDFQADYEFACAAPDKITAIDLGYFKAFPKSQKVAVQIVTANGQSKAEVTPAKPRVELGPLVK